MVDAEEHAPEAPLPYPVDELPEDGIYSVSIPSSTQPGIHHVEVSAASSEEPFTSFRREAATWFKVWSDVATFTGDFTSGTEDTDGDGNLDVLWIEVGVESTDTGLFLATGKLTDLSGEPVATASTAFSLQGPGQTVFYLYFAGSEIYAAHRDGPFVLSELEIFDGSAGFVTADYLTTAHTTTLVHWTDFARGEGVVLYMRGDSNADGEVDISDGITILEFLFTGELSVDCRDAGDANGDEALNISDALYIFQYLFLGGDPMPAPFPLCGTGEKLGCEVYPPCAP